MLSERFNWDRLRVFRLVSEFRSMSAAARAIGESTPTISRRINDLERELGTKLFERSKRGVELTAAGKRLMDLTRRMQELVETVGDQVAVDDSTVTGAVKIMAGDGLGPHWLARLMPAFHRRIPGVQIDLEVGLATDEVAHRLADLAIVFAEPSHPEIIAHRLGTLHYMCFASAEYLDRHGRPSSIFEFQDHKLLMHTGYVHQMARWSKNIKQLKDFVDYSVITNSGTALISLARHSGGVAILPSYVAETEPDLVPLELPALAPIQFWLTYTERVRRNQAGKVTIEWLLSVFNDTEYPWFASEFVPPAKVFEQRAARSFEQADDQIELHPAPSTH